MAPCRCERLREELWWTVVDPLEQPVQSAILVHQQFRDQKLRGILREITPQLKGSAGRKWSRHPEQRALHGCRIRNPGSGTVPVSSDCHLVEQRSRDRIGNVARVAVPGDWVQVLTSEWKRSYLVVADPTEVSVEL
jgi:hypothetical protein